MKIGIMAILSCCLALHCLGQRQIRGIVRDAVDGEALVGATVRVMNSNLWTNTDTTGFFQIEASKSDILIADYVGYESKSLEVQEEYLVFEMVTKYVLEDLIISGIRAYKDDPVAQTTVSKKEIQRNYHGDHPIYLLEKLTPSVFTYSESGTQIGNYGNLRLRGIDQQRINFTLNGVPLNDMIDHGVFFSNFTDIGSSFESIQIQRGVGLTSNGAASYGGSVNFESLSLSDADPGAMIQTGIGSFGTTRLHARAQTGKMKNNLSFMGSYSHLNSEGYRYNTFTRANTFFFSGGYFGTNDMLRVTAFDSRSQNGLGYSFVLGADLENDPRTNYLNKNDTDDFRQHMIQLQYSRLFSANLSGMFTAYYSGAGGDYFFTWDNGDGTFGQINYPLYNTHRGIIFSIDWAPTESFTVSSGVHSYLFGRVNEESISPNWSDPYYREKSGKNEFSAFAKAEYTFSNTKIIADLQVRDVYLNLFPDYTFIGIPSQGSISKHWTFLNPKIGIHHDINSKLSTYASFGRVGREPTRIDILGGEFNLNAGNFDEARGDNFEAEYVNDLEVGIRFSEDRLVASLNYFFMDFDNEIAPIGEVGDFGTQRRRNIASSRRTGLEVEANYLLTEFLNVYGNFTYQLSQIDSFTDQSTGDTYSNTAQVLSPEWIYAFGVRSSLSGFYIDLGVNGISESYLELTNDPTFVLPSYFLINGSLGYSWKFMDLRLDFHNLADEHYYSNGAPVDIDFDGNLDGSGYHIGARRSIQFTTTFDF